MQIGEEPKGGALVIAPVGRVDSVSSGELEKVVLSRIDAGARRLVLDLTGVEYISSAGLRVLLIAAKRLKEPPAALVLCGIGPGVRTRSRARGLPAPLRGRAGPRAGARPGRGVVSVLRLRLEPRDAEPFRQEVRGESVTIGRSSRADLVLADRFLSRQHARLFLKDDSWFLEDLGSRNTTFLNDRPLAQPTPVRPGDVIRLAESLVIVEGPRAPSLLRATASRAVPTRFFPAVRSSGPRPRCSFRKGWPPAR